MRVFFTTLPFPATFLFLSFLLLQTLTYTVGCFAPPSPPSSFPRRGFATPTAVPTGPRARCRDKGKLIRDHCTGPVKNIYEQDRAKV